MNSTRKIEILMQRIKSAKNGKQLAKIVQSFPTNIPIKKYTDLINTACNKISEIYYRKK